MIWIGAATAVACYALVAWDAGRRYGHDSRQRARFGLFTIATGLIGATVYLIYRFAHPPTGENHS